MIKDYFELPEFLDPLPLRGHLFRPTDKNLASFLNTSNQTIVVAYEKRLTVCC